MARSPVTADPAADAAVVLRRIAFVILMIVMPVASLFARRSLVVLGPIGIVLIIIAAAIDGGARPIRATLSRWRISAGAVAGLILIAWCLMTLIWTPFRLQAAERLFNIIGTIALAVVGMLALPERMRSSNLYLLPLGVAATAVTAVILSFAGSRSGIRDEDALQNFERGLIVLVLLMWPALAWLRSRERDLQALLLAIAVAIALATAPFPLPLAGLVAGAVAFAVTAARPALGTALTAVLPALILVLAPLVPLLAGPLAAAILPDSHPIHASLETWHTLTTSEPARLVTGHGFETSLRGRAFGLLPETAPRTLPFELWYDLGVVGVLSGAAAIVAALTAVGRGHAPLVPGAMASFAAAFALACLGIGTAQMWWFTALVVTVLIFGAIRRGQFRTTRPKAILRLGT